MTNGTKLSLAIASCVDEQLSWCTLPLAVPGGDVTTLLSAVDVGTSSIAEEFSEEVADELLADLLIVNGVEVMIKVVPWDDEVTSGVVVAVVVVVVIAEVLNDRLAGAGTDDVASDGVTGDKRTLERVGDEDLTLETGVTADTFEEVKWNVADDAAVEVMTSEVEAVDIGGVPLVVPLRLRFGV